MKVNHKTTRRQTMRNRIEREFCHKGYSFEKFDTSDTRRIQNDGEIQKYYATKGGRLVETFKNLKHADLWIEFK